MKQHLIRLTDNENNKLQKLKKELMLNNVNEVFQFLINLTGELDREGLTSLDASK